MTLWIITTGSSDVELKTDTNWKDGRKFYEEVEKNKDFQECRKFEVVKYDEDLKKVAVPVRALGLVYGSHQDSFKSDLSFPLLDVLTPKFKSEVAKLKTANDLIRVIILITDQRNIFSELIYDKDCPFWQDTCTLKPIFEWYFQEQEHLKDLKITPKFITIESDGNWGIDHWNEMLTVVKEKLSKLECDPVGEGETPEILEVDRGTETVYVSHQASTPAISSAVQFVTISQFKKEVQFLLSNQFYREDDEGCYNICYEADVIGSSNYWRSLQFQKAKKLIINGQPGSALELIKGISDINKIVTSGGKTIISELEMLVNLFNFKAPDDRKNEFEPIPAIKRVRQALDLAEIFFKNEDYLPGVNVLAAAHETFLKAAILYKLRLNNKMVDNFKVSQLVKWDNTGFRLQKKNELTSKEVIIPTNNKNLSTLLDFPVPQEEVDGSNARLKQNSSGDYKKFWEGYLNNKDFALSSIPPKNYFEPNESRLCKWLLQLHHFEEWYLLKWSCTHYRTHKLDLRNQNLHNLLGVRKLDVVSYLLGNPEDTEIRNSSQIAKEKYERYKNRKYELKVEEVVTVYLDDVKKPFLKSLNEFGWDDSNLKYKPLQQQLEELANSLDAEVKKPNS